MKRTVMGVGAIAAVAAVGGMRGTSRQSPLIVHEWGTITTRHAPNGTPQGRLNRLDPTGAFEGLPSFVHRYEPPAVVADPEKSLLKLPLIPGRPDVTMRLETPVIYFYRAADENSPRSFDVSVRFRGGVLNEFYPNADASVVVDAERVNAKIAKGSYPGAWPGDVLDSYVVGRLGWRGVALDSGARLTPTTNHVWIAPRRVPSTNVVVNDESERYLFYRGVAHLDALFQTELQPNQLILRAPRQLAWMRTPSMPIPTLWLVDARADGSLAFREHSEVDIKKSAPSSEVGRIARFAERDFAKTNYDALRKSMKQSLIAGGLYASEAEAMLETWDASYFRAPGLRLLYLVPNEWIGYYLPLTITAPHELKRVIVGRIDLLTNQSSER